jgi:2-C-methyl-D-erythritol 4-phosphate cytidylyltransferase
VFNGLQAMRGQVQEHDWVMVHDAARPCLTHELIGRLLREVSGHDVGGLLAVPLADTLKRASRTPSVTKAAEEVETTVARDQLWQAQTPQMFRYGLLLDALGKAGVDDVTDESSAVERLGHRPRLVMGSPRNLKVTRPEDALLAELILKL